MKTQHEVLMGNPEFRRLYAIEGLVADASETIARLMAEQNVTKAELARRLRKSRSWVTQMLSGKANLTVRTLAEAAFALGAELRLDSQRRERRKAVDADVARRRTSRGKVKRAMAVRSQALQ